MVCSGIAEQIIDQHLQCNSTMATNVTLSNFGECRAVEKNGAQYDGKLDIANAVNRAKDEVVKHDN